MPGRSIGKIIVIIILSFKISTFKIKKIDHLGKETYTVFGLPIQNKKRSYQNKKIKGDRIGIKINSQRKVFICDTLCDLVSVTIWRLYDVMIAQTHANACYVFFYLHAISIRSLCYFMLGLSIFKRQNSNQTCWECQLVENPAMSECCFLISKYHENCNAMSFFIVTSHVSLCHGTLVFAIQLSVFTSSLWFLFIVYYLF